MKNKYDVLLKAVEKELKKAKNNYLRAKKSADEIAVASSNSPSQSGDRYHSQGSADLAKQKHESLLLLKKELEKKREAVCFKYNDEPVYIVDNPVLISGIKIISSNSFLGKKILKSK